MVPIVTWTPPFLYSQNFEDLYLWRLFKDKIQGFYIDVGAYHPETDSVTKIFYDQGWSGINIEPVPELFELFQRHRERDVNLPIAISTTNGRVILTQYGDSGLSSLSSTSTVSAPIEYKEQRQEIEVGSLTLFEVIKAYSPPAIDFLKIDVEGQESDVILSASFELLPAELRPKVILLEATMPTTRVSSPARGESRELLCEFGYKHFFFDGLNDYYCSEHDYSRFSELMLPPNVFDGVPLTPQSFQDCRKQSLALRKEIDELIGKLQLASEELQSLKGRLDCITVDLVKVSADRDLLLNQYGDLKDELNQLHITNTSLNAQIVRQFEKLAWLRRQREATVDALKRANNKMFSASQQACRVMW